MGKKYTASEVRSAIGALEARDMEYEAGMLHAYADRLEADEKAVPVAWRQKHLAPDESQIGWILTETRPAHFYCEPLYTHPVPADADWKNNVLAGDMKAIVDGDGNVLYVNKAIFDLQVHKTEDALATVSALTADTERLAEALRAFPEDPNPFTYRRCYANARAALATHSAQAQPPAASATPNLASYWRIVAEAAEVLQMFLDSGVKLPPNWRGPLLDELSGLSAMMLAAQENK